jgi:pimeloyl-ACP methyl ester carboxylesterase
MIGFLVIIKWGVYILVGIVLLVFIGLLAYKQYLRNTTRIETPNGISSLERVMLGGLQQWIFIRGMDENNPVLIFLHGGPGAPLAGLPSSRRLDSELIKYFTVVHWDQRGAGKSYDKHIPVNSISYNNLVEDCYELIDIVRNRFNTQKVVLVGHSSGSIIGIKTVHKYPEKIQAYVGVGQIINECERQKKSYNFVLKEAEKSKNLKIQKAIKEIGPPPYDTPEKFEQINGYVFQYGGVVHRNRVKQIGRFMLDFLTSPEYSLSEGIRTFMNKGFRFSLKAMWQEIYNVNLTKEIQSMKIPVYFFEGKYDMATPSGIVESFYNRLEDKKDKKIIIFESSAHVPMSEEKEKYENLLINMVLKKAKAQV